jgi:predicted lipoprotein with Yx(FWY)xxD motif
MHSVRFRSTMAFTTSAFGLALVLAACGSSSKTSTAASGTTATTSATTAPSSSAPSSSSSSASGGLISVASSSKGQILVDAHGKSLYVFDMDKAGKIACLTGCTSLWPPLVVPGGGSAPSGVSGVTATLGTVMRPDGMTQITSDGRPLYTFARDTAAGDVNGDGFGGIWHVAKASGNGTGGSGATNTTATTAYRAPGY